MTLMTYKFEFDNDNAFSDMLKIEFAHWKKMPNYLKHKDEMVPTVLNAIFTYELENMKTKYYSFSLSKFHKTVNSFLELHKKRKFNNELIATSLREAA